MSSPQRRPNIPIFATFSIVYILLIFLFAWQTWEFVTWLFPQDELIFKILTVFSFDGMALLWAISSNFYIFASRITRSIARIGFWISFVFALAASVLYLVIQSIFKFHLVISQVLVNWAYTITIIVLVFNILMILFFIEKEIAIRFPKNDTFLDEESFDHIAQTTVTSLNTIGENTKKALNQAREKIIDAEVKLAPRNGVTPSKKE